MWSRLGGWFRSLIIHIRREALPQVAVFIVLIVCVATFGLSYFESIQPVQALWWTLVTITTVGYGDITPVTVGGRVLGVATMLAGIGLLGLLTASIASLMVSIKLEGLRGMRRIRCTDHFVICGWNHNVREILDELRSDHGAEETPVVLIAELDEKPLEASQFFFVRGDVTHSTMEQANMPAARAAIVLGDDRIDAFSRDARSILTTLTIKTAHPRLYTCVELIEANNVTHCRLAQADEIIVSGALTSNLLVRAALDHGVTRVVSELLSTSGHELYLTPTPRAVVGKTFLEALQQIKRDHDALIVAVQPAGGSVHTNPVNTYQLQADDQLYLIAEQRPEFSS
ncbi:hypothetical protein NKDENANG_02210 [Candidatus Entotheonellaceae bacterium PAL068K]